jgi:hypothetical protein
VATVPLCPPQIPHDDLGSNPGRLGWEPGTNDHGYGTANFSVLLRYKTGLHVLGLAVYRFLSQ